MFFFIRILWNKSSTKCTKSKERSEEKKKRKVSTIFIFNTGKLVQLIHSNYVNTKFFQSYAFSICNYHLLIDHSCHLLLYYIIVPSAYECDCV